MSDYLFLNTQKNRILAYIISCKFVLQQKVTVSKGTMNL